MIDEVLPLPALGHAHLDFVAALRAQSVRQQLVLLNDMGDQDAGRNRLVVVELSEKGAQNLFGGERAVGAREIGAIAPVLAGPEEEHFNATKAAGLMHGKDVRLLDHAWIDSLMGLHG